MNYQSEENILQKNLRFVETYLNVNKNWLQWSENVIHSLEKNLHQSKDPFLNEIVEIERILKDLEKMFEE